MGYAFNGTTPNLNFAVNHLNRNQGILQKLLSVINGIVDGLTHGAGGTASNEKVEAAVKWCIAQGIEQLHHLQPEQSKPQERERP